MPWTLHRHILWELVKLIAVSTIVLVLVMSFAATVQPLVDGILGPASLAKFVFYSAPTMLGFVLPFAAAFASTLVFIRMTNDNELVACAASGLSYFQVLYSVIAMGVLLSMTLFGLLNFVIPGYWRAATQTLEKDLMSLLVNRLNEHRPFEIDDFVLHADRADVIDNPPVPAGQPVPDRYVQLVGMAVSRLDRHGQSQLDVTAETAHIALYRDGDASWLSLAFDYAMVYEPGGSLFSIQKRLDNIPPVRLPSSIRQRAKFLSLPQLNRLSRQPRSFDQIRAAMGTLVDAIAAERLQALVLDTLAAGERVELVGPQGEEYELQAPVVSADRDTIHVAGAGQRKVELDSVVDLRKLRLEADTGVIEIEGGKETGRPLVQIELSGPTGVKVYDIGPGGGHTNIEKRRLGNLTMPQELVSESVRNSTMDGLLRFAGKSFASSTRVQSAANQLREQWLRVQRRITGRKHERAASSIAGCLLLLLGAVLSMLHKDQMPLVVYFWSFLLAIVGIVVINSGFAVTRDIDRPLALGLVVLWFGNVALAILLGFFYCRLARN